MEYFGQLSNRSRPEEIETLFFFDAVKHKQLRIQQKLRTEELSGRRMVFVGVGRSDKGSPGMRPGVVLPRETDDSFGRTFVAFALATCRSASAAGRFSFIALDATKLFFL